MINISNIGSKQIKVYRSLFTCFFNYISKNIKVDMTLSILRFKHIIQSFTHINSPHVCVVKHVKQTYATQSGSVSAISFEFTNKSITSS